MQLQIAFLDIDMKYAVKAMNASKAILAAVQSFLPMNFSQVDPLLSVRYSGLCAVPPVRLTSPPRSFSQPRREYCSASWLVSRTLRYTSGS